jgi:hypothetical protein
MAVAKQPIERGLNCPAAGDGEERDGDAGDAGDDVRELAGARL